MKNIWFQQGASYFIRESSHQVGKLPAAVYKTVQNPQTGEIYLDLIEEKYTFPYKIYGMQEKFIKQLVGTYKATNGNLGILLNGIKGTGKTVCSKMICNELLSFGLPVILVTEAFEGLSSFINQLQQDVVIFIDEYEKLFSEKEHSILSVMDGALSNEHRKTWLLTTNKRYISEYMLDRPGRIRYIKNFSHMEKETIEEIVDDMLQRPEFRSAIIHYLSTLENLTIDLVKAVVEEVNIHGVAPDEFASFFNATKLDKRANIYVLENGKSTEELFKRNSIPSHYQFDAEDILAEFMINNSYVGEITEVIDDFTAIIETSHKDGQGNYIKARFRIEVVEAYHASFQSYSSSVAFL